MLNYWSFWPKCWSNIDCENPTSAPRFLASRPKCWSNIDCQNPTIDHTFLASRPKCWSNIDCQNPTIDHTFLASRLKCWSNIDCQNQILNYHSHCEGFSGTDQWFSDPAERPYSKFVLKVPYLFFQSSESLELRVCCWNRKDSIVIHPPLVPEKSKNQVSTHV